MQHDSGVNQPRPMIEQFPTSGILEKLHTQIVEDFVKIVVCHNHYRQANVTRYTVSHFTENLS